MWWRNKIIESSLALNLRVQFNSQVFFGKRLINRGEFIVAATFDVALAFEMDNHRALLRLQGVMSACGYEALNDVIKRVVVVVEQDNVPFIVKQDVRQDVFLGQGVRTANTEHQGIIRVAKIAGHACLDGLDAPSCGNSNLNGIKVFLFEHPLP